jgi:phosphotransacetylase
MSKVASAIKEKLHTILTKDYEECQFFFAAADLLSDKLKNITALTHQEEIEFSLLRDTIGELGICIANIERGLEEAEECYTKLVEALEK